MQMDDARAHGQIGSARSHAPRLAFLGGFNLTCRGRSLSVAVPAQRLLALIALSPSLLDRERAADQLWPGLPPERARGNLRNALWRIRSACPALLEESSTHLRLSSTVPVDVHELTRIALGLDQHMDTDEAFRGVEARDLLAELLPGWQDEWLVVERERLHSVALHALEQLALLRSAAGRPVEALDAAYLAVQADPLRESAVSALIQVHLAQGNRIEALRAYTLFRTRVREELGVAVEPIPRLRQHLVDAFRSDNGSGDLPPLGR